ncbi:hypothetical protein HQ520_04735 [bacterium]|nr:hypothetical protein [bacterium]
MVYPLARKAMAASRMALTYLKAWRCDRPVVVLESDDWGSLRTSSREAFDQLQAEGWAMERSHYSSDALETDEDLDCLFEVLDSVRDARGRPACLTANTIMANPDFARIREAQFEHYFHEPVEQSLLRSPGRQGVVARWREGLARQLYVPQLHGLEHVCWWEWLDAIRKGSAETRRTFEFDMCGLPIEVTKENLTFFKPLYLLQKQLDPWGVQIDGMVRQGARMFENLFGYTSRSAMAPCYAWTDETERIWAELGVRYFQGWILQEMDTPLGNRRKFRYLGEPARPSCLYLVRNTVFEPVAGPRTSMEPALRQVARAFRFGIPAVICTHRVNYIGAIDPGQRDRGLIQLRNLLRAIVKLRPDVLFLSSPELGYLIEHDLRDPEQAPPPPVAGAVVKPSGAEV